MPRTDQISTKGPEAFVFKQKGILQLKRDAGWFIEYSLIIDDYYCCLQVCGAQLYIRYVDGNHPGSCHDSFIFNSSDLDNELQRNFDNGEVNTWILGYFHYDKALY